MTEERTDQNGAPVAEADVGAEERLDAEAVPVETEGVASEAETVDADAEAETVEADVKTFITRLMRNDLVTIDGEKVA